MKPIAIIDCAIDGPSYRCTNKMSDSFKVPITYHWVSRFGLDSLKRIEEPSAYIIYGSKSNVDDKLAWQIELAEFIKDKIERGIPTLGICFGHQLMADAYGARVDYLKDENTKAKGVREIEFTSNKFGYSIGEKLSLFVTHYYEVKELPDGFIHLASSQECKFDGLAHQTLPFISFQGHPEASEYFLSDQEINLSEEDLAKGYKGGKEVLRRFISILENK